MVENIPPIFFDSGLYSTIFVPVFKSLKRKRIQKRAGRERSSPIFSHLSIRKYSQPFSFIQQFV